MKNVFFPEKPNLQPNKLFMLTHTVALFSLLFLAQPSKVFTFHAYVLSLLSHKGE